ncbi:hypothetical protein TRVA0_018S01112 [Trichomonascus vanleenenianus]|uniref:Eaf7p n=1 Tax=Trichomonascus vanleenenianus TaxID=2268995 RepID=UPI003ECAE8E2
MGAEWTIQQETSLFRAICRFKPAGKHKHFRMICIYETVNNSHVDGARLTTGDIWARLAELYNLDGLDEIEDGGNGEESPEEDEEEFRLPWEDYGQLIVRQAEAPDADTSDGNLPDESPYESSHDEEETTSSPKRTTTRSSSRKRTATPRRRTTRSTRATATSTTPQAKPRRSTRKR